MEKGFNDEELADIMNEIENLEQEFASEISQDSEPAPMEATAEPQETEEVMAEQHESEIVAEQAEEPVAAHEEKFVEDFVEDFVAEQPLEEPAPVVEEEVVAQFDEHTAVEETVAEVETPIAQGEESVTTHVEETVVAQVEEPVAHMEESMIEEPDTEMNEVLEELAQMPVEEVVATQPHDDSNVVQLVSKEEPVAEVHEDVTPVAAAQREFTQTSVPQAQTSMSFNVQGNMNLNLNFTVSDKTINLSVSEDGFEIELEGGMKFTIPLEEASQSKKVA